MSVNGLIQGCLPIMRYNYGAKKYERVNRTYHSGTAIAVIIMAVGTLLLVLFPRQILFVVFRIGKNVFCRNTCNKNNGA